ncbi:putative dynamin-related protein 4A [Bidens hawaiensis]|uniref:putative dynamin-related protein 4A n=1 Tax=Bidens hawaiensis TaxID=980011 RepID=UPI0040495C10
MATDDHNLSILEAVDSLRRLNIRKEGITLPNIVFIGDDSSDKNTVLESLAGGVTLPAVKLPLIIILRDNSEPEFHLEIATNPLKKVEETKIYETIETAMADIERKPGAISEVPVTLVVKKDGLPNH